MQGRGQLLFTRSVGVFHLGHLRGYQLGCVFLLAAVSLSFLAFLHLFIVVLNMDGHTHTVQGSCFLITLHGCWIAQISTLKFGSLTCQPVTDNIFSWSASFIYKEGGTRARTKAPSCTEEKKPKKTQKNRGRPGRRRSYEW